MSEQSITPGPWSVEYNPGSPNWPVAVRAPGGRVVDMLVAPGWQPETVANANAIAALPDLLAACERYQQMCRSVWDARDVTEVSNMINAAIAKARGE